MTSPLERLKDLVKALGSTTCDAIFSRMALSRRLVTTTAPSGLTFNPAIFARAIDESALYDADIAQYARAGDDAAQTYERLIADDLAADLLRPTYLKVSPHPVYDTRATIDEARRRLVAGRRSESDVKVPATRSGLPAIGALRWRSARRFGGSGNFQCVR